MAAELLIFHLLQSGHVATGQELAAATGIRYKLVKTILASHRTDWRIGLFPDLRNYIPQATEPLVVFRSKDVALVYDVLTLLGKGAVPHTLNTLNTRPRVLNSYRSH